MYNYFLNNIKISAFEVDNYRNGQNVDPRLYEFLNYSEQNSMRKNYSQSGGEFKNTFISLGWQTSVRPCYYPSLEIGACSQLDCILFSF